MFRHRNRIRTKILKEIDRVFESADAPTRHHANKMAHLTMKTLDDAGSRTTFSLLLLGLIAVGCAFGKFGEAAHVLTWHITGAALVGIIGKFFYLKHLQKRSLCELRELIAADPSYYVPLAKQVARINTEVCASLLKAIWVMHSNV